MKRCNNCGWSDNPDTSTRCEKCNNLLDGDGQHTLNPEGAAQGSVQERHTISEVSAAQRGEVNLKRTVLEVGAYGVGGEAYAAPSHNQKTQLKASADEMPVDDSGCCPSCGYPLRSGSRVCPQCHVVLQRKGQKECVVESAPQATPIVHKAVSDEFKTTISPSQRKHSKIRLTAVNAYEDSEFVPLDLLFTEEENILNRANVESDNPTISRRQHALLTKEGGKWYLENKSSVLSTALVLTQKHELQPGDKVIIGDRIFEVSF